jgi:periplasmic protein TonB
LKDGSISNIEIRKGVSKEADFEAIRVIKMMPKWKPGKINGEISEMKCQLPIVIGGYE